MVYDVTMRFNNQFVVETSETNSSSKMDIASEPSESNESTMRWKSISRPELGLAKITKSYAILCEDESNVTKEASDFKQVMSK